jgi:hypothetical protein
LAVVLLALHNAPGWAGPAAVIGSLFSIVVLILDKTWPPSGAERRGGQDGTDNAGDADEPTDPDAPDGEGAAQSASRAGSPGRSFAFGHVCLALLVGFCVPLALSWLVSYLHSGSPISALADITSSDNTGVAADATVTFTATVPASHSLLTISFTAQQAAAGSDNCINGATLDVAERYGSTVTVIGDGKRLGTSYTVPVSAGIRRFQLLVTFIPQPGFTQCSEDINVATAQFRS